MSIFNRLFGNDKKNILSNNGILLQGNSQKIRAVSQNLPIDIIYDFLKQDFDEKGYIDAQRNPDITNQNHNKELIKADFEIKVREVLTEYYRLIQLAETQIALNTRSGNTFQVSVYDQKKQLYTDHVERINTMNDDFKAGKPEIIKVLTSYDSGFNRGIIYVSDNFNN